jgi:hypothetical protein
MDTERTNNPLLGLDRILRYRRPKMVFKPNNRMVTTAYTTDVADQRVKEKTLKTGENQA